VKLDSKERKLLLLAFDAGATPDEALGALRVLFRNWLVKYPDGHELIKDLESEKVEVREKIVYRQEPSPYGEVVLKFGKYEGEKIKDVDPEYLLWVLDHFTDLWPSTRKAIEHYLEQSE
jgi:hypothetical protein